MRVQSTNIGIYTQFFCPLICLLFLFAGCKPLQAPEKPLSLGQFTEVSAISISSDGSQILFEGCGHKEYTACTIYRFDREGNRLYRYLPRTTSELLYGARYSPSSTHFALSIIPLYADGNRNYEDSQIALMQQDGTDFKIVTNGRGLKTKPSIGYDERHLVFFKSKMSNAGSPLRKQKSMATGYDLYHLNLATRQETRLTKYEFYSAGSAYFTGDNKKILFEGDSPMSPDYIDKDKNISVFEKKENIIFTCYVDGSDENKELTPYFTYSQGSKMPVLFKDGSLVFEGHEGIQRFIYYFKRLPSGSLSKISDKELGKGTGEDGKSLIVVREMTGTPNSRLLAILDYNQDTSQRYIRVLDLTTKQLTDIVLPAVIENIAVR